MTIEKYISTLLYRYQCVTVPSFGAFVTENVCARVSGTTFTPAKKVVSFNVNIKNNDGLLANHIALEERISFEKATEKIAKQVALWINELTHNQSVFIAGVGVIRLGLGAQSYSFEPSNSVNYLMSSFGFSDFISAEIKQEILNHLEAPKETKQVQPQEAVSVQSETSKVETPKEVEPVLVTLPTKYKPKYNYLKYAAVIALTATGGLFGTKVYFDHYAAEQALLVQQKVQEKVHNQIMQATFLLEIPQAVQKTAEVLITAEESRPYHLIAGAFRSEANADDALNTLLKQGYEAQKLKKNRYNLIPVAFGSYKTKEEAEAKRTELQQNGLDAWLFIE